MANEAVLTRTKAEDIEGLRALISQVILEERDKIVPVSILQDVEEIKRSPVGAVIRMEGAILHLQEDVAELKRGMALMATKEELRSLQQVMEARFGQVDERITGLQQVAEARFGQVDERIAGLQQVMVARFEEMGKRINILRLAFFAFLALQVAILVKLFLP
jgi:exonuclease VII small subunit